MKKVSGATIASHQSLPLPARAPVSAQTTSCASLKLSVRLKPSSCSTSVWPTSALLAGQAVGRDAGSEVVVVLPAGGAGLFGAHGGVSGFVGKAIVGRSTADAPPSTINELPVTIAASGEARNSTALATSSGSAARPIGTSRVTSS